MGLYIQVKLVAFLSYFMKSRIWVSIQAKLVAFSKYALAIPDNGPYTGRFEYVLINSDFYILCEITQHNYISLFKNKIC